MVHNTFTDSFSTVSTYIEVLFTMTKEVSE